MCTLLVRPCICAPECFEHQAAAWDELQTCAARDRSKLCPFAQTFVPLLVIIPFLLHYAYITTAQTELAVLS